MNKRQYFGLIAVCGVMSLVGSMVVANMLLGDTRLELMRTDLNGNNVVDIAVVADIAKAFGSLVSADVWTARGGTGGRRTGERRRCRGWRRGRRRPASR